MTLQRTNEYTLKRVLEVAEHQITKLSLGFQSVPDVFLVFEKDGVSQL